MNSMDRLYIAYGSNLNLDQMKRRCPTAEVIGTAELKNWRLWFYAMVYIMNEAHHPYGAPATGYFDTIREGYESANFDTRILYDAVSYSKEAAK